MAQFVTACPRNCYSTCSMRVTIEDGRLKRLEPIADNRATPEGICLKGLSYWERQVSPDRILTPLRRTRAGGFEPVTWDQALDLICEQLVRARDEVGPQALLYYAGSGTKGLLNGVGMQFWRLFGGCTTTYGDLCWPAGLEATRLTLGDNLHSAPWDLANARLIVLWGKNAAETNIHQMVFVERALDAGARLIVVDPRRTQTAERAELLVRPRPGTDGALALAVAHLLVESGRIDRAFIDAHVLGYPELAERLRACTPEWAEIITDVPARDIAHLADAFGDVRPATVSAGFGMQRYTNSGQAMRAIIALLAITGNIGKPGAGWVYANLQSHVFDEVKDPIAFYPPAEPDGVVRVSISTARLGRDMLATRDPPLRIAWVERGNPITQNPETNTVLRAFRALDFRIVIDQFLTDTAREADLVLPSKTMFEQSDVIGAYWHPYLQLKQRVLDPPGEVKPESEVYWMLAHRLGLAEALPPGQRLEDRIPGPSEGEIEAWLERRLEPFPDISLERLRQGPVLAPGHREIAFADGVFPTPSGKIELLSAEATARWGVDPLPDYREPRESARRQPEPRGRADRPRTSADAAGGTSTTAGRPDRAPPLYLMTPNTKNRIHSQFNNLRMIRQLGDRPFAQIHPSDAAERGVTTGQRVRIFNGRGTIEVEARVDAGIKRGCVSVTNGWWISEGGAVNFCSLGRETDIGHGAAFHDNMVELERVPDA